jgi:hypothetical protein
MKRFLLALAALSLSSAECLGASYPIQRVSYYTVYTQHSLSACGVTKSPGKQVAVSRDLFRKLGGCGAKVNLTLLSGESRNYLVWDVTNQRYRNTVDILIASHQQAVRLGITRGTLTLIQ